MRKKIFIIIGLILIGIVGFQNNWFDIFQKKTAYAVGDLNVLWGVPDGDPIFVVENMLPGDMEQRSVDVINGGTVARAVNIRGVKTEEFASFSSVLDFVISKNGTDLYGGTNPTGTKTLQDFFDEAASPSGLFLSTIAAGGSTSYTFKATFPPGSGNEFMSAKVVFDLIIGIATEVPAECSHITFSGPPIFGTSSGDVINGTSGNDLVFGLEGGDYIDGKGGADCLVGGTEGDAIFGRGGNDVILGQDGGDALSGGDGNDTIFGGERGDALAGQNGDDVLRGGNGNDGLNGGVGKDKLFGEGGIDSLVGGTGDDELDGGTPGFPL